MSIDSRSQSSNSTTLAASTRASPSSAFLQRAISLNLPKKLIKEKSALSKCKAFVKGARAATPPTVESDDVDEDDIDESVTLLSNDDDDSMEEESEEDEDDPNIDPRLLGHTKATLASNKKSKSSGSSSINAPLGKLPTKHQSSTKRAKWQLEAEIAQLRADVAQISATMTQIADHMSVRAVCSCNGSCNGPSTTSSSSDSLYASVMAPSQIIVANSAAEYSSKAKIDVMFTIDEARKYIAQKAGKTVDDLHPSTVIPPELCTRTADGKDASTIRQNQIRKTLREVCVVIETLPDKREEEDGMIKTRGIQYFRDNYRTVFDRLVDKLEVAIPELQLCADHWKALQLISRRLKSLSEKDTRRNKLVEKQKLKVKRELQEGILTKEVSTSNRNEADQSPDGEAPASSDPKGKGKIAATSGAKSKSQRSPAVVEPTTTSTTAKKPAESRPRPRPVSKPVSKQRQRKNKVAEVESIHNELLADGDGNPSSTTPLSVDADNTGLTGSGLTPNLDGVQFSSAPYSSLPRFPLPRTATPSPASAGPSHTRLPPLRPLFEPMKMPPRPVEYTGQRFSGSQQDYDYRQGQGQGSRPYGYQQGHERGQSQGYDNPSYGTNSNSTNPYGANPYTNPYRLSPPPTHHSTQA